MRWMRTIVATCASMLGAAEAQPVRFELDNGATVLIEAVPGTGTVALERFVDAGFLDDPAGWTQMAHLVEHLVCYGATGVHESHEAFDHLSRVGMTNAETLATCTHYDVFAPASKLGYILEWEAARLAHIEFDAAQAAHESGRCDLEVEGVSRHPMVPLMKFGVMAAHQVWRHDATHVQVTGRTPPVEEIESWWRDHCGPASSTYILVGDVEVDEAKRLFERTIGEVEAREAPGRESIDVPSMRDEHEVTWDVEHDAMLLAYPVPAADDDRAVLALWGSIVMERLMTDEIVNAHATFAACPGHQWPIGDLPLLLYATVKQGADIDVLGARLDEVLRDTSVPGRAMMAWMPSTMPALTPEMAHAQSERLGMKMEMILGHQALQRGMEAMRPSMGDASRLEALVEALPRPKRLVLRAKR